MEEKIRSARDWFSRKADTIHARAWLAVFSFTESSIFFVPPDPLLAAMVFVHKDRWLRYTVIASVASILGAIFGYIIGAVLFETIGTRLLDIYNLHEPMRQATDLIHQSVFVFTLTAAFTPIPFKVAVLAAGFAKANFFAFLVAAFVGRSARYLAVAYIAKVFGENADEIIKRFWWYATIAGVVVLAIYGVFLFLT